MEEKPTTLSELDKLSLEVIKANQRALRAEAKEAIAKSEKSDIEYKNFVLQIFMKYGLTEKDSIDENGIIKYGDK